MLQEHPSVVLRRCAEETRNQIEEDNRPEELNGPIGYGPLAIQPDGPLREQVLNKIIDRPWFENFIIACILVACAMLAYEGNGLEEDDPIAEYFLYVDLALLGVFVIECMLRILHKGLLFTNVAYLKDPWNQLDVRKVSIGVRKFKMNVRRDVSQGGGGGGGVCAVKSLVTICPLSL